jgi:hypothetical protein
MASYNEFVTPPTEEARSDRMGTETILRLAAAILGSPVVASPLPPNSATPRPPIVVSSPHLEATVLAAHVHYNPAEKCPPNLRGTRLTARLSRAT